MRFTAEIQYLLIAYWNYYRKFLFFKKKSYVKFTVMGAFVIVHCLCSFREIWPFKQERREKCQKEEALNPQYGWSKSLSNGCWILPVL